MIVDCAVYTKGVRVGGTLELEAAFEAATELDSFVWIGLLEPEPEEFERVRREFNLHQLAVDDAIRAHQRPKVEVYDDSLFVVLKTARYDDLEESVEFAEIQLFVGARFVVSVRHGQASSLAEVRRRLEQDPEHLLHGPATVMHAVMDRVVDDYMPVIAGLDNDVREIEVAVFDAERSPSSDPTRRIYELKREVLDFQRDTKPLLEALERLASGRMPFCHDELAEYFRDVEDHLLKVISQIDDFNVLLSDMLSANLAQASVRQNDDMRRISAMVAVGAVPTVVGAIYGMNFSHMPELDWAFGYPAVMAGTGVICAAVYLRFKRSGWL